MNQQLLLGNSYLGELSHFPYFLVQNLQLLMNIAVTFWACDVDNNSVLKAFMYN